MAMHRLDSAVNTALCPRLTTRTRAAPTPTTSEVTIGVPVRGETLPRTPWNGSAFCLAIEYIIRAPEVWQASVQTMIAITTSTRMMRPAVAPKTASTTYGRPTRGEVAVGEAGRGHQRGDQQQRPADAGHDERADDGPRRDAARRVGLLGQFARGVEADHDVGGHQPGGQPGPDVGRAGSRGRAGGVDQHRRAALGVREQRDHDGDDAEDLQDDAGAADDRHQPDPDDVDRGRDGQQDDAEQHRVLRAARRRGRGVTRRGSGSRTRWTAARPAARWPPPPR